MVVETGEEGGSIGVVVNLAESETSERRLEEGNLPVGVEANPKKIWRRAR